jgi:hypothetical protein
MPLDCRTQLDREAPAPQLCFSQVYQQILLVTNKEAPQNCPMVDENDVARGSPLPNDVFRSKAWHNLQRRSFQYRNLSSVYHHSALL